MLYAGDERRHNNPDMAYVDAEFIRGGGRVTENLATLLTDFSEKTDQLKENVTLVYVNSEDAVYRLKSIANITSLANGWKPVSVDFTKGVQFGTINSLTGLPALALVADGDVNSELVFGTASTTGQIQKVIGLRAGGDKGQNGAPAGRYPMRIENNFGWTFTIPGTNANVGGTNHFGVYQADGVTELLYIDNLGRIRMAPPLTVGKATDSILVIGEDGSVNKISQSALQGHYKGKYTTLPALQAVAGKDGDYAILDTGTGTDAVEYIYDSSDSKWVKSVNLPASTFGLLGGLPGDNAALAASLGTLQPKEIGKGLYPDADKAKLAGIVKGFTLVFLSPKRDLPYDYFETAAQITGISLKNATAFSYSLNEGTSYITPTLPLAAPITIPAGIWVMWRITFANNATNASAYIKLS
jgi:hypothetical protein